MKNPLSLRQIGWGAIALAGQFIAQGAHAAEVATTDNVEEADVIIVHGQRTNENPHVDPLAPYRVETSANLLLTAPIMDAPKAITILSSDQLSDMGVQSMRDLFRSQPGITLGTGEGGNAFGDRIFIRGFDARGDVFIDGARDPGVGSREIFAVQQVEIMRGPSSAFGGRGTTGGSISLITKQPGAHDRTSVELGLGTENTYRLTVDNTAHFGEHLAVRTNLMGHEGGVAGRNYVDGQRWGAAVAGVYTLNDDINFGADYYMVRMDYMPDWGVPWNSQTGAPFNGNRNNFYGILARDFGVSNADVATLQANWQITPSLHWHGLIRAGSSLNAYTASAPERPNLVADTVSANGKRRDADTDNFIAQSHWTWDGTIFGLGHAVVAGLEYGTENVLNRQRVFTECATLPCTGTAANPVLSLSNPNPNILWGRETAVTSSPLIETRTSAAFLVDTIELSPQWQALLAVRADQYRADVSGLASPQHTASDFVNFHAGLVYKPVKWATIYLAHASSSNPSCEQLDALSVEYGGCDARIVALDPVENRSTELGGKFTINGHLDVTGTFFEITRNGVPVQIGGGASATIGTQDQQVIGAEFTVAGNPSRDWSIAGGFTLLGTEITRSDDISQIGASFPNVSEISFSLTNRYQFTDRLHLGATIVAQSEKSGGTAVAGANRLPAFTRVDLFGGYTLTDDIELRLNVQNVGDALYYDALYRSASPFTYVAPGRSAMLTIDWHF